MPKRILTGARLIFLFLLLGFSGSGHAEEDQDFKKGCRECHQEVIHQWDTAPVQHSPYVRQKCQSCHSSEHKKFTAEQGQPCLICHNLGSEKIKQAHGSFDVKGANCFECHYTHGSERKGMLKETVHPPFESGMCSACHTADENGGAKVVDNIRKACLACHEDKAPKTGEMVHEGFEMLECTDCHSPHTARRERLLRREVSEICFDCHDASVAEKHPYDVTASPKIKTDDKKTMGLTPDRKVVCTSCHNPHFEKRVFLLKETVEGGKLCYRCHQETEGGMP